MNSSRFSLEKDLSEWIATQKSLPWGNLSDSDEKNWTFHYNGDADWKPFIGLYPKHIENFSRYFPNMDIWLKNIFWDDIFENSQKIIETITQKVDTEGIIFVAATPLELAVIGETLKKLNIKNVVYNFNRMPAVNSISKTLEATLFILGHEEIDWLKNRLQSLVNAVSQKIAKPIFEKSVIFLDENDTPPNYNTTTLDPYIKNAIGFKEHVVTYKAEDIPHRDILLNKGIKTIFIFDQDDHSIFESYYQKHGDIFDIKKYRIPSIKSGKIGYYEEYLLEKNREYLEYRKNILTLTKNTATQTPNTIKKIRVGEDAFVAPNSINKNTIDGYEKMVSLFGLGIMFIIFLLLVSSPLGNLSGIFSGGGSSSSSSSSWG